METLSRRSFIQIAAGAAAVGIASPDVGAQRDAGFRGSLCFFSKHLPRMNARELARTLKGLGFDGVDLTVRPGGHVDPKRVAIDLDRKSTRLNSSHSQISYAVFCLKKKKK